MIKVLVTGASGFIGRNLCARLLDLDDLEVYCFDVENSEAELESWLRCADIIFHLAGINRPKDVGEYETGNAGFTHQICEILTKFERIPKIVMSSSVQAELDNPYGISKRRAEEYLQSLSRKTGSPIAICRLKNVFGKWCKPEYNSVTATFCHNIANDLPISISDPNTQIELVYIDDVVEVFLHEINNSAHTEEGFISDEMPSTRITLSELAGRIQAFHDMKTNLLVSDFSERFNQRLYATYQSYVNPQSLRYELDARVDSRGSLAEFIKSRHFGQIFVSRTYPGITRGNHYHHTKTEKFLVLVGKALIRMRHIEGGEVKEYRVNGEDFHVVDIPPGFTHSITNIGEDEMVTLFWASEVFDPDRPDTYYLEVDSYNHSVVKS